MWQLETPLQSEEITRGPVQGFGVIGNGVHAGSYNLQFEIGNLGTTSQSGFLHGLLQ